MPSPLLTPEDWHELRQSSQGGMSDEDLAAVYSISKNTIRQKRWQDKQNGDPWLTPKEIRLAAEIEELKKKNKTVGNHLTNLTEAPSAMANIAAKLAKLKEETPLAIAEKTSALILEGLQNLIAPKGWKEMSIASKIFSDSVGLNKGGGMVIQVGGAAWQGSAQGEKPRIVTIQAEEA